jgi:glucose-1-phosphatase
MHPTWFLFDLGNTVIKLGYDRVIENIRRDTDASRDQLVELFEQAGGYRDMERGLITFWDFYQGLCDRGGYRGSITDFHAIWSDFFEGPVDGIQDLLEKIRESYKVAFLSNSNEVHAEVIPKTFAPLFRPDDIFLMSFRFGVAKPDPEMFRKSLDAISAKPEEAVFVDDLIENVMSARKVGMRSYQFTGARDLETLLENDGLL